MEEDAQLEKQVGGLKGVKRQSAANRDNASNAPVPKTVEKRPLLGGVSNPRLAKWSVGLDE